MPTIMDIDFTWAVSGKWSWYKFRLWPFDRKLLYFSSNKIYSTTLCWILNQTRFDALLSSAFIGGDVITATRGPFICSLIRCPFFWRGVNRPQVVSRHRHDWNEHGRSWDAVSKQRRWWRRLVVIVLDSSHPIVWLVRHVCSDKVKFSSSNCAKNTTDILVWVSFFSSKHNLMSSAIYY